MAPPSGVAPDLSVAFTSAPLPINFLFQQLCELRCLVLWLTVVLAVMLRQLVHQALLLLEEAMAAMALQQRVQLASLLVQEPTAATHHTPPKPRLRLL